jgi:hypothetical protein
MIAKRFVYKIYSSTGMYITTWKDVQSEPEFSIPINGAFSEMQVKLARPLDNYGENLDVKYGNVLKLYAFDGDSGQSGVLIYSGFISTYEPLVDGGKEEIVVTFVNWWWELNRYLLEGDGNGIDSLIYGNGYGSKINTNMTSNVLPSPQVASASTTTSGYDAFRAFNGVKTVENPWASTTLPAWLKLDMGVAKVVTQYNVTGRSLANANQNPKSWVLQGSNDDVNWIDLDKQTNEVSWIDLETRTYSFENDTAYRYHRIYITEVNGTTLAAIQELELIASLPFAKLNATSIKYLAQDPSNILKDILDKFTASGGKLDYGAGTVDLTGTVTSYLFNTNFAQEALEKVIDLCPMDWFFRIGSDDKVYLKAKSAGTDHKFHIGRSVSYYRQEKRLENIVNFIYFKGKGFYKKYSNSGSVAAYGRYSQKIVDEKVVDVATADIMANAILNKMASPEIRITARIIDNNNNDGFGYDIESLKVGDTCKIFNATSKAENLWDSIMWDVDAWDYDVTNTAGLVLQIQKITYHPDYAELEISNRQPDMSKRIEEINKSLIDSQTIDNPVIPQ